MTDIPGDYKVQWDRLTIEVIDKCGELLKMANEMPKPGCQVLLDGGDFTVTIKDYSQYDKEKS